MALQVWLPFIDSTIGQGCYDLKTPSYTNMTIDQAGKIGSCEKGASIFHLQQDDIIEGDDWTIAGWTKCEGTVPTTWYVFSKNSTAGFGTSTDCALAISRSTALWGCVGGTAFKSNYTFTTGSWYHVALTATPGEYKFYVNGTCIGSGSQAKTRVTGSCLNIGVGGRSSNAAGTTLYSIANQENIRSNDIRLYDHCLSAREVQEIAKGLILHYPLSDTVAPANGKIYDCSGYGHHGNYSATPPTVQSGSSRRSRSLFYKNVDNYFSSSIVMPAENETISLSYWFKSSNAGTGSYHEPFNIGTNGIELGVYNTSNGRPRFGMMLNGVRYLMDTGSGVQDGNWHHIAHTYNGSTMCIYIDGTLRGSKAASGSLISGSRIVWSGRYGNSTAYGNANTSLSDIRVYSTALSAEDVRELAKNPISVCKGGTLMCQEVVE